MRRECDDAEEMRGARHFTTAAESVLPRGATCRAHRLRQLALRLAARFRTIQDCPKDLRLFPPHPEPALSWHSGFRERAHARHKTVLAFARLSRVGAEKKGMPS